MLAGGPRRTLSALVVAPENADDLTRLLPVLSDTLTECGYPWEIVVADRQRSAAVSHLLVAWSQLAGFRTLALEPQAGRADALRAGLVSARGDAVLVVDASLWHEAAQLRRLVMRWEASALLATMRPHAGGDGWSLTTWDEDDLAVLIAAGSRPQLPASVLQLALLDRDVVELLVDAPGRRRRD